ncbi:subtilisin-like protease SBT3.18 isoform X1 [Daucus carota subsp. sativus]|uniref:subtilisin-like protease SBT3.18 isoform X1 n=1 Tax=Daucus carota subsp. sativus TaxID=79200 RepID=UPI0007F04770|nr:PREDICTED: subtilisin-like protease SBT3.18 [Daucus carota subsp. sativus]
MATAFQYFGRLSFLLSLSLVHSASTSVYIVYLGQINHVNDPLLTSHYHSQLLTIVFDSEADAKQSMLYSYKHSFSGFSAKLNSTQATRLSGIKGVVSVFKSKTLELHTTRSWDFMGLPLDYMTPKLLTTPQQSVYGSHDVIVGVFDTGIWPESASFKEEECMKPIPRRWKGKCCAGQKFDPSVHCSKKVIGARYYLKGFEEEYGKLNTSTEYRSVRDYLGHGTHTASIAVGSIVQNASFLGFAQGIARGGNPKARLAVYKICWNYEPDGGKCTEADILAAFDDALCDGVDVISASLGLSPPLYPLFESSADIGSFHATQKGVSVVFSAGNDGPTPALVQNVSPWSICVAAASIDRNFPTQIVLDNDNLVLMGESLITKPINGRLAAARKYFEFGECKLENWNRKSAAGRIILCFSTEGSDVSLEAEVATWRANASGLILVEPPTLQTVDVSILPTVYLDIIQGTKIIHYLAQSQRTPVIRISPSTTVIKKSPAPITAYFSSRGPSSITPDVLKPDITAPGVTILAAWPTETPPTLFDKRTVKWNFQAGTSMSCPHVSGVISLIKSLHPDWSPAALKSAILTTAYTKDTTHDTILGGGHMKVSDPFDIGAGHINPMKAMDPGLVYDMTTIDYIMYLCSIAYTEGHIRRIVSLSKISSATCPKGSKKAYNINFPSIMVSNLQSQITIKRTVRNVSIKKTAIYFASVVKPHGVEVSVWPSVLIFSYFKDELSYYVTLTPTKKSQERFNFGEIILFDGFHFVRSPLIVRVNTTCTSSTISADTGNDVAN